MTHPTPEMLHKLLRYESETGKLFWRKRMPDMFKDGLGRYTAERNCKCWNTRNAGKEAFTALQDGYPHGSIFKRLFKAHRVIWAMVHNEWPPAEIDHKNQVRDDNKIDNLRAVTHIENMMNQPIRKANKSGFCGVFFDTFRNKWAASISPNGKTIHLGRFLDKTDAIAARKAANIKYGFHENHGRA